MTITATIHDRKDVRLTEPRVMKIQGDFDALERTARELAENNQEPTCIRWTRSDLDPPIGAYWSPTGSTETAHWYGVRTTAQRKRKERTAKRLSGLQRVELWLHPDDAQRVRIQAARLTERRTKNAKPGTTPI